MTTTDTKVVAAETEREKGVYLYKQETHVEDSSSTIIKSRVRIVHFARYISFGLGL